MPIADNYMPSPVHANLGEDFYDAVRPAHFPQLTLRYRDQDWAKNLGLGNLSEAEWLNHFGRFEPLPHNMPEPLALRYHGHQFQHYNPDLGDGRGFLFAQIKEGEGGRLLDLGTKGSGQTPWSRAGDGKLTLKGGVREILATRLLDALGVNTSKSFSLIETHEKLTRGDEPSPTRSSVLVRLNHSHIRIGTFQRFANLEQPTNIARLVDHCVTHYYPQAKDSDGQVQTLNLFDAICKNVAETGANWMHAGFVHGVLNTDNINITGESFDYGPWRFVPECDPKFTAAYFDQNGLYAFARQPSILQWNLARLAECLTPFVETAKLETALEKFSDYYGRSFEYALIRRLGIQSNGHENDEHLTRAIWDFLEVSRMSFEQFFFDWFGGAASEKRAMEGLGGAYYAKPEFEKVHQAIMNFEVRSKDALSHSYFQADKPVTILIDEVEAIWKPIADEDDWSKFENKLNAIANMREALLS